MIESRDDQGSDDERDRDDDERELEELQALAPWGTSRQGLREWTK